MSSPILFLSFDLPVFLDARSRLAVVVGGGAVGQRKARMLLDAGVSVRVVALEPQPTSLVDDRLDWRAEPYKAEHLDGADLVFTATGWELSQAVHADARARDLWVCRADSAPLGNFITPMTLRRGRCLRIAVSTNGASPALARRIRDRLAET